MDVLQYGEFMRGRMRMLASLAVTAAGAAHAAHAGCTIEHADIPVTLIARAPRLVAKINGGDTSFLVDSGSTHSILSQSAASEAKLNVTPSPRGLTVSGIGGDTRFGIAAARTFTLSTLQVRNAQFLVLAQEFGGTAGILGQNLLQVSDVEYDLANSVMRLVRSAGCADLPLAYWAPSRASVVELAPAPYGNTTARTTALLNDEQIRVLFDTGAYDSFVTLEAARRAGVTPETPGAVFAGLTHGIGRREARTWIVPVARFRIGSEEIRNTRLRIGEAEFGDADMLLGADFFLSHRILIANSRHKAYFTYSGGPVFNLTPGAGAAPGAATPAAADVGSAPLDAEGFSRRGNAYASRGDLGRAIEDLTRACELAPAEARYFYERGTLLERDQQPAAALADFDRALRLKPDQVPALIARARLKVEQDANAPSPTSMPRAAPPLRSPTRAWSSRASTCRSTSCRRRLHSSPSGCRITDRIRACRARSS
jgi:predicted aspartyl protease